MKIWASVCSTKLFSHWTSLVVIPVLNNKELHPQKMVSFILHSFSICAVVVWWTSILKCFCDIVLQPKHVSTGCHGNALIDAQLIATPNNVILGVEFKELSLSREKPNKGEICRPVDRK